MKRLLLLLIYTFLTACTSITSTHMVGGEPLAIDKKTWEGAWIIQDDVVHLKVMDEATGEVMLIFVDLTADADEKLVHQYTGYLRKSSKNEYFNIVDSDNNRGYFFARFKRAGNELIVWNPDYDVITDAVEGRQLQALKDDSSIEITATGETLVLFLESNDAFMYEEPAVFRKLSDSD